MVVLGAENEGTEAGDVFPILALALAGTGFSNRGEHQASDPFGVGRAQGVSW